MKCQYCGGEIPDTAMFCIHCGQKVVKPAETKPAIDPSAFDEPETTVLSMDQIAPRTEAAAPSSPAAAIPFTPADPFGPATQQSFSPEPSFQPGPSFQPQSAPETNFQPQQSFTPEPSFQPQSAPEPSFQPQQSFTPEPNFQPEPSFQPDVPTAPDGFVPIGAAGSKAQGSFTQPQSQAGSFGQTAGGFAPQANAQPQGQSFAPQQNQPASFGPQGGALNNFQQAGFQQQYGGNFQQSGFEPDQPKKKSKAGLIIGIAAAALVLVAAIILIILKPWAKPKTVDIDLNPYASMTFSGNNGAGTFQFTFDETKFVNENKETIQWMNKKLADETPASQHYYDYCINGDFSAKSGTLSNGDKVVLTWKINEEWAPYFNVNVTSASKEFTVSGLTDIQSKDPFEGYQLMFTGTSPYIDAYGDSSSVPEPFAGLQYKIEPQYDLKAGDTVTVTLMTWEDQDPTAMLEQTYAVHPSTLTKTFTVENTDAYITKAADIPADAMQQLIDVGQLVFEDSETLPDNLKVGSFEYVGNLFLTIKEPDYNSVNNALFTLFKVSVTVTDKVTETNEAGEQVETEKTIDYVYYYDVEYDDLVLAADGTIDIGNLYYYTTTDTVTLTESNITVYGYANTTDYVNSFNSTLESYNIENNLTE